MKIEHITLGGNSVIRDSTKIAPELIELVKPFQIFGKAVMLPFPETSFTIKVTSTLEGSVFDIIKNEKLAFTNLCCFQSDYSNQMLELVSSISKQVADGDVMKPVYPNWIYTIPVFPFELNIQEQMTAGEIELYIYNALYLARLEQ